MNDQALEVQFSNFMRVSRGAFQKGLGRLHGQKKVFSLLSPRRDLICQVVEELERSPSFLNLTEQVFREYKSRYVSNQVSACQSELRNFFRWDGLYIELFEETTKTDAEYLNRLRSFLEHKKIGTITYAALLDGAKFSENWIKFGDFGIRRFTSEELDGFFDTRAREIFDPGNVLDTKRYSSYWYLIKEEEHDPNLLYLWWSPGWSYLLKELQAISMFPTDGKFSLPWFARKMDLANGDRCLDFLEEGSLLLPLPHYDHEGKIIGESEQINYILNKDETVKFKKFVPRCHELFQTLGREKWGKFIHRALGFFMLATINGEANFIQLITALEVLIVESGEGITDKIARRVAVLVGEDEADTIRKWEVMRKYYRARSDLIHGKKDTIPNELYDAPNNLTAWVKKATLRLACLLVEVRTEEGQRKVKDLGIPLDHNPRNTCLRLIDYGMFNTEARRMVRAADEELFSET